MTGIWASRPDGLEVGVVPFAPVHPVEGLRGRWHVQVRAAPGRAAVVLTGPLSEDEARAEARRLWRTLPSRQDEGL